LIERLVTRLKQFRRIATRYDKTATIYRSMLSIATTGLWIKNYQHSLAQGWKEPA
jgi:transposase